MLTLVTTIATLNVQIKELERQLATAIRAHPDGVIFRSLFKGPYSVITSAELLAEIGDCRARYPSRDALAGDAGQAAVAIESGKRKAACFRWGCNKRLRSAFCTLADSTRHWHPWAQDLYAAARARGHDHPRALRTLGRACCRIVWQCWQDGVPYDPARHRALQRHIAVTIPTPSGPRPDLAATQRMADAAVTPKGGPQGRARSADRKQHPLFRHAEGLTQDRPLLLTARRGGSDRARIGPVRALNVRGAAVTSEVRVLPRSVPWWRGVFAERDPARLRTENTILQEIRDEYVRSGSSVLFQLLCPPGAGRHVAACSGPASIST